MTDPTDDFGAQVIAAYTSRPWTPDEWRAHLAETYGKWRPELGRAQRRPVARALHDAGAPWTLIGETLGEHRTTVMRDVVGRARPSSGEASSVYVIGSPDFRPVKIGKGYALERLEMFRCASPFPLELLWSTPGGLRLERALHARFEAYRVRGEWFEFPGDTDPVTAVVEAVEQVTASTAA
ncbi:GIY-YIG nuclease family protein [Streptomyces sp. CAI-85]|uniref:GIY-YIG nuclease family protein n=1 Tax=Streptomyces sp. CAI-85 TaxID=1472662 RepID=UPI001587342C|nr:GIY-YIG nuclease family protein [Streptomyces sp. CAI-85]NUV64300.1 GIY-YIG nuclease family protein [Streptomyces sp. CAI-85]